MAEPPKTIPGGAPGPGSTPAQRAAFLAKLQAQLAEFEAAHPQVTTGSTVVAPKALAAWGDLQTAVATTLSERLTQSQEHRSLAWAALARV